MPLRRLRPGAFPGKLALPAATCLTLLTALLAANVGLMYVLAF